MGGFPKLRAASPAGDGGEDADRKGPLSFKHSFCSRGRIRKKHFFNFLESDSGNYALLPSWSGGCDEPCPFCQDD